MAIKLLSNITNATTLLYSLPHTSGFLSPFKIIDKSTGTFYDAYINQEGRLVYRSEKVLPLDTILCMSITYVKTNK